MEQPPSPTLGSENKVDVATSEHTVDQESGKVPTPLKKGYVEELAVWNGVYPTRASTMELLIRPFVACLTPVCLWAALLYGVAITWLVLIATSVAQLFSVAREFKFTLLLRTLTVIKFAPMKRTTSTPPILV